MRCLSCQNECAGPNLKIRGELLLCPSCDALAEKAELEIDREIERARKATQIWLQQHILRGGLLRGGSGVEEVAGQFGSHVRNVLHDAQVPGMQGASKNHLSGDRDSSGNGPDPKAG